MSTWTNLIASRSLAVHSRWLVGGTRGKMAWFFSTQKPPFLHLAVRVFSGGITVLSTVSVEVANPPDTRSRNFFENTAGLFHFLFSFLDGLPPSFGNPSAKPGFLGLQAKISRNASVYAGWTQVLLAIRAALGFRVKKRLFSGCE